MLYWTWVNLDVVSLKFRSSFPSAQYPSLGVNLPHISFTIMTPWANEMKFGMNHASGRQKYLYVQQFSSY